MQEEAQTMAAQTLEVVYGLMKNMKVVMDSANDFLINSRCNAKHGLFT